MSKAPKPHQILSYALALEMPNNLNRSSEEAIRLSDNLSSAYPELSGVHANATSPPRGLVSRLYPLLTELWQLLDAAAVSAVLYALARARDLFYLHTERYLFLGGVTVLLLGVVYSWSDLFYRLRSRTLAQEADRLLRAWGMVLGLLVIIHYVANLHSIFPRSLMLEWVVAAYLVQLLIHIIIRNTLHVARRHGYNIRRALVIGCGPPLERFVEFINESPWLGIKLEGFLAEPGWFTARSSPRNPSVASRSSLDREKSSIRNGAQIGNSSNTRSSENSDSRPRYLGGLKDLTPLVSKLSLSEIYVTLPLERSADAEAALRTLINVPLNINWIPDLSLTQVLSTRTDTLVGQPLILLSDSRIDRHGLLVKRLEDLVLATLLLVLFAPLILFIACAVKLSSPGPAIYKQVRRGLAGRPIVVWKFRSMRNSSRTEIAKQATPNDSRLTAIGRLLRRWSLDELPQLFNVLQGRMSLVGPRPHPLWLDDKFYEVVYAYMQRHRVKPGLTGWAQVHGFRGETDTLEKMEGRLRHDLYYITHWSPWLDIKIVAATVITVLSRKNAY